MKDMKKIIVLFILVTLTLSGCSDKEPPNVDGSIKSSDISLDVSQGEVSSNEISSEPTSNVNDTSDIVESKPDSSGELNTLPPQDSTVSLPTLTSPDENPKPVLNVEGRLQDWIVNTRIVDKDNNPVKNGKVIITSENALNTEKSSYFITDNNGKLIELTYSLYNSDYLTIGTYNVEVWLPIIGGYDKHKLSVELTQENARDLTLQLPTINQNEALYNGDKRTDIYMLDSDNKPVSNVQVYIIIDSEMEQIPNSQQKPPALMSNPIDVFAINKWGYTDNDGRITFVENLSGECTVQYLWYKDDIIINENFKDGYATVMITSNAVNEFTINTLLR